MLRTAYLNGRIYTCNPAQPWAEAMVTTHNRITFVGTTKGAREYIDPQTEVFDLGGSLVVPGFIDCHAHTVMGGQFLLSVDLSNARSHEEFAGILRKYCATRPAGWVTGGNWNHENWPGSELPHREWIDSFTQDIPVFVSRMDYHMGLANSAALKLAGIGKDTSDPPGGMIVRDALTGEPTGILKDRAMELIQAAIPEPTAEDCDRAAQATLAEARRFGVTSIHDICYAGDFRTLQRIEKQGKLTSRMYARLPIALHAQLRDAEFSYAFGGEKLSTGSLKAFADGSLGSSTALFFDPYADDARSYGLAMDTVSDGRLRAWSLEADRAHLQLSIHAIGDRANAMMLDLVEEIVRANPAWDRRFRMEHAQHVAPADFARFARLGVIVSAQPYHLYDDGCWAERKIGRERLRGMYAFKSLIDAGVRVCFGSDWPVVTLNPLAGIYAAVTRHTADGRHPGGLVPEERISVEEAVKCYTVNAAYASYREQSVGSLETGKLADFAVLSEDIFLIPPERLKDVAVRATVCDGVMVHGDVK